MGKGFHFNQDVVWIERFGIHYHVALDGISLTRQAVAAVPGLRVMLMSGFADELSRASGIKAARLTRVTKPFTLEHLAAKISEALAS